MTHPQHATPLEQVVQLIAESGFQDMAKAIEILLNEAMKLQRADALNAQPYQRTDERTGYANGFKPKRINSRMGELNVQVPQTRNVPFYPDVLERGERSEKALKLAIAEMYVQGVSTRKVAKITAKLCGLDISSSQVSRASKLLDEELEKWRTRALGEVSYLILDARYEKVRCAGSVRDCAVLVAIGIMPDGRRSILGVSVALSEAEVHWRAFLSSLIQRGMHGVRLITSDAHEGLQAARRACLAGGAWQRCQFHLMQNAMQHVPKLAMRKQVAADLRSVFDASDRHDAERRLKMFVESYADSAPKLATWAEQNIPQGLAVFAEPPERRKRLRTTNMLERQNREIKRRTRVATLFPNEDSLLRLVSAVLIEISEDWETGTRYLNMENE